MGGRPPTQACACGARLHWMLDDKADLAPFNAEREWVVEDDDGAKRAVIDGILVKCYGTDCPTPGRAKLVHTLHASGCGLAPAPVGRNRR